MGCCRNKLVQITYALANVYDDSPDLEVRVTDAHRQRAEEMMACVESGDITRLREMFLEVRAVEPVAAAGPDGAQESVWQWQLNSEGGSKPVKALCCSRQSDAGRCSGQ